MDIWLHSRDQGGAAVSLVQCKHWTTWKVGVKPVRELRGVMAAHGIARGQFVTTSGYTADAFEGDYARPTCASCGIKLVERTARATGVRFWGCANHPRCKSKMQTKA